MKKFAILALMVPWNLLASTTFVEKGSDDWRILQIIDGVDPAIADPDFNTSWFNPTVDGYVGGSYDGLAFAGGQSAPFSYGEIDGISGGTTLTVPPSGSRYTSYFYKVIDAGDGAQNLKVSLLADDGAFVYLNGQLIARDGVTGADTFTTMSSLGNESEYNNLSLIGSPALQPGLNLLAVSLHQSSTTSSDLGFDLELSGEFVLSAADSGGWAVLNPIDPSTNDGFDPVTGHGSQAADLDFNATWKNQTFGGYTGVAYDGPGFTGGQQGPLSYGNVDGIPSPNTVLASPASGSRQTAYFIKEIDGGTTGFDKATFTVLADDGAFIYLNGNLVGVVGGLPLDAAQDTWSKLADSAGSETAFHTIDVTGPDIIQPGPNLLAVSLHQNSTTSPDLGFSLKLTGEELASPAIVRGPYLQSGSHNQMIVRWRTTEVGDSVVRYGDSPTNLTEVVTINESVTDHIVKLTGLTEATKYYYQIESSNSSGTAIEGGESDYYFKTYPTPGTQAPTRLWVIGDSGTQTADQDNVYEAYLTRTGAAHTDAWLMLGDNAYNDGTDLEFQGAVFDAYPELLRNTTMWSCIGNHETPINNGEPYIDIHSFPTAGECGGVPSGSEYYYSYDHGNIHFICLDSSTANVSDIPGSGGMIDWLEADLQATDQDWIIAYFHHGPYTKGSHDSDTESAHIEARKYMTPLLEAYGVDLVLSGHSHSYERSMLVNGHHGNMSPADSRSDTFDYNIHAIDSGNGSGLGSVDGSGSFITDGGDGTYRKELGSTESGTIYTICGASGKLSRWDNGSSAVVNPEPHPVFVVNLRTLGSMIINIDGDTLNAQYLDDSNVIRDDFTIVKPASGSIQLAPVSESLSVGSEVTTVTASGSGVLAYSITAGNEAGMFTIDGSTGIITSQAPFDYETDKVYNLTIGVTDDGFPIDPILVTVNVENSNEAPGLTNLSGPTGEETIAYNDTIAGSGTDPDFGDSLSYSKVSGPSWLTVDSNGSLTGTPALGDAGLNIFTIRVTDSGGLTAEATLEISIAIANTPPSASFASSVSDLTVTLTDSSTDTDGSVVTWNWNFGDGNSASTQNATHSYAFAGTYTVTLTVTDDLGLTSFLNRLVTVSPPGGGDPITRFAALGDFGSNTVEEENVATMLATQSPDFIVTAGDNRYDSFTFQQTVGDYYGSFLPPVSGGTSPTNRFFPAPGNHDYTDGGGISEYLAYFDLPGAGVTSTNTSGNERYYDVIEGHIHFFMIDSEEAINNPADLATQQAWLQTQMSASTSPWQIVVVHHAPYSSGSRHGSNPTMQWNYADWGADAVLAGHDHTYERISRNGIPYFVNGLAGRDPRGFGSPISGSEFRYNADNGAMIVEASPRTLSFQFLNTSGQVVDYFSIGGPIGMIDRQISQASDDAEEQISSGAMSLSSSDLELVTDSPTRGVQAAGLRFQHLAIPQGVTVASAYLEFECDEADSSETSITIQAQASDDPLTFGSTTNDITSRPLTTASVGWEPTPWTVNGRYQSPDLKAVVQEVVDRPGWSAGNSMVFVITGSGERTAESFNGESSAAARLHIVFERIPVPEFITIEDDEVIEHPGDFHVAAGTTITVKGSLKIGGKLTLDVGAAIAVIGGELEMGDGSLISGTFTIFNSFGSWNILGDTTFNVGTTLALVSDVHVAGGKTITINGGGEMIFDGCFINSLSPGSTYNISVAIDGLLTMARCDVRDAVIVVNSAASGSKIHDSYFTDSSIEGNDGAPVFHNLLMNTVLVPNGTTAYDPVDGWANVTSTEDLKNLFSLDLDVSALLLQNRTEDPLSQTVYLHPDDALIADINVGALTDKISSVEMILGYHTGFYGASGIVLEPDWDVHLSSLEDDSEIVGKLDSAIGLSLEYSDPEGTNQSATIGRVTLSGEGNEGQTQFFHRVKLSGELFPGETRFTAGGATPFYLTPFTVNSGLIILDGTAPVISATSADGTQLHDSVGSPVDILDAAPALAPAYTFRNGNGIELTFTATDAGGAGIDLTDLGNDLLLSATNGTTLLNTYTASAVEAAGEVTYTVSLEVPESATTGTYEVTATVFDRSGNPSTPTNLGSFVIGNELLATVELEGFVGAGRDITFVATDGIGGVLASWTKTVSFTGPLGRVNLENVPALTTGLSARTDWNLRSKVAVSLSPAGFGSPSFTGEDHLPGGDLNRDNVINTFDYTVLRFHWTQTTPVADVNGSGIVSGPDFNMIRQNFYKVGDSQ